MKNYLHYCVKSLCILMLLILSLHVQAQTMVELNTGGDTSEISGYSPINRASATTTLKYSRANFVILPSELSGLGIPAGATITKLAFYKGYNGTGGTNTGDFKILLNNSAVVPPLSTSTTWASITTSHTLVYSNATQSLPEAVGWFEFNLSTPFTWTGGSLEVATDWFGLSPTNTTPGTIRWQTDVAYADYIVGGLAATAPTTLNATATAYKKRPILQITYTATACTAPPVAGIATAIANVCPGSNFTLSLTGNSSGGSQLFQWQDSIPGSGVWNNITTAIYPVSVVSQTVNKYYRAYTTCSGQSDTSSKVFVSVTQPLNGNSYTINSASATSGNNFQSFTDLATRLNCAGVSGPVTVTVQPGTYTNRLVLNSISGVSSTNRVIINGNGQTLTYSPTVSAERSAIVLNGAEYVTINNLTINVSGGTYGWGVLLTNKANNNSITNCTITSDITSATSTNWAGITSSASTTSSTDGDNASNTTITGNTITGGQWGISLRGTSATVFAAGNVISNNIIKDFFNYGVFLRNQDGAQVTGNQVSRPTRTNIGFFAGLYLEGGSQNNLFKSNKLFNPSTGSPATGDVYAIYFSATDAAAGNENKVINNLIYNIDNTTTSTYGIYNSNSDNVSYYHNTIALTSQAATAGNVRAFYQTGAATGINFQNNIIYITRKGSVAKYGIYLANNTVNSTNNIIYMNAPDGGNNIGYYGSARPLITDWQGQGFDGGSFDYNPVFTSATNFAPTNSQVNNTGTNVNVTDDINGTVRNVSAPDAGAIEWEPVNNDAAITQFVLSSTVPSCATTLPVQVTITNSGVLTLNSVTVNWTVNTVAQTPVTFTGLGLAPGASINQTLNTIPVSANILYNFSATASNPNGVTDQNAANNTATYTGWRSSLTGAYTINKSTAASATNYTTIQSFADALNTLGICGPVTVTVATGTGPYTEQVLIKAIPGTDYNNRVTFDGNGNTLQLTATSTQALRYIMQIKAASYVTVQNFVVSSMGGTYGYGINIIDGSSKIKILNNTINLSLTETSSSNTMGITTAGPTSYLSGTIASDSLEIAGNTINGGGTGIQLVGDFTVARRNTNVIIKNNIVKDFHTEGIYFLGAQNVIVSGNDISRPNRTVSGSPFYGFYSYNAIENYLVEKNKIHDMTNVGMTGTINGIGMYILGNSTYNSSGTFANNLLYNFNNNGYQYGIHANTAAASTVNIYHNTFSFNDGASTSTAVTRPIFWAGGASTVNMNVMNNIFYVSRGGTGIKTMQYVSTAGNASFLNSNGNVSYFVPGTPGTLNYGGFNTTYYADFALWQAQGKDAVGTGDKDPVFTNTAPDYYKPTSNDIDGAVLLTTNVIADDILGVVRGTNPDPGAYEFTPALPVKLISFDGLLQGNNVITNWSTAMESNISGYEVERSINGTAFAAIGHITVTGNSNILKTYSYTDLNARTAAVNNVLYYRLKIKNINGGNEYSKVIMLKLNDKNATVISISPNPVINSAYIKIKTVQKGKAIITVNDIAGKQVLSQQNNCVAGSNVFNLNNIASLQRGTYFITVIINDEKIVQKVIK